MGIFNKKNQDEILYKSGCEDTERKLIPEWRQKLADLENEKDEVIEGLRFEIIRLEIQLKNWKDDHERGLKREQEAKKKESELKRDRYKIERFKDEVREKLSSKLNKDNEEAQDIFRLLGESDKIESK